MPLYSVLLCLVLLLGAPFWLVRMLTSGRYRRGLRQRLGAVPPELGAGRAPADRWVWLHAVSVGEVLAAAPLLRAIERSFPDVKLAVSTTTATGQTLAQREFPDLPVFFLPLDFAFLVRRYLRRLQPDLLLLMESELWPNLLRESRRSGAGVVVVNARLSDRSFPRYLRLRRLWRPILEQVNLFLAQGTETADRLRALGVRAERIAVAGNLKFDTPEPARGEVARRIEAALPAGGAPLVCGSTLPGEEALLLRAWPEIVRRVPRAALLLAPRHPDRFAAVAALVTGEGHRLHRASVLRAGDTVAGGEVVLLDTIGDLSAIYGLAAAAFVGGSLVPAGGHNPLEPARFAVPVAIGSSFANFREIVTAMRNDDAIRILSEAEGLAAALADLIAGGAEVRAMGERGRAVFEAEAGATARVLERIAPWLRDRRESR